MPYATIGVREIDRRTDTDLNLLSFGWATRLTSTTSAKLVYWIIVF